ncbi:cyclin-T [Elysia marginata]|uniref:Cyclin-T n=1 Tax=Elysia marginata TaxID=1093978 RepID=A0AAV4FCU0_9GAST|nr:cyclin-T [Elysia marginata]
MEESTRDFKWLFSEEKLRNTPSQRIHGVSPEKEATFRQKEAMLIQAIGSKAHLTQLAVNTSVVFMHRFFMYRSVLYYPRVQLAIAFALAGGKVEESETARKLEHLIRSAVEVLCANKFREFLDKSDQFTYDMDCRLKPKIAALKESRCSTDTAEYLEMRKLILECETEIYSVIGFQLQITHPHHVVLRSASMLGGDGIKDITHFAYNLATASSQLTMLCVKYKPETIGTMCLNVALKVNCVELAPQNSQKKWYHVYDGNTDYTVSEEFLKLLKACPLLPTWMCFLGKVGKRSLSGPVPRPGGYSVSRQPMAAARGISSSSSHNPAGQRYSNSSSQSAADPAQHRSSQGENRTLSSSQNSRPPPSHSSSVRPQSSRSMPSMQGHPETQPSSSTSRAQQSSSATSVRAPQDNPRHLSRVGSSGDVTRQREDQPRPYLAKLDPHSNSEQDRQRAQSLSHRQQESNSQPLQNLPVTKAAEPPSSLATLDDETSPPNDYSPVAVRPPSPPFPPPNDIDLDESDEAGAGRQATQSNNASMSNAGRITSPDISDNNSSGFSSVPVAGPKLSLSDYRQRASAKLKEKATTPVTQAQEPMKEEIHTPKMDEVSAQVDLIQEGTISSPKEEKPLQAIAGYSFSKPQDSPNNPRITIKVKRDPSSGDRHSVKYTDSRLKIKIKPPKPESESEITAGALENSSGLSTPAEEGEILEDSPSPASSTGSSRRSEGLKIRLSVPKSADNSCSKRESDHWSSRRSGEHESGHRSHHHGHHRSHHKSKKHKEHRSSRHEGKSFSGHHSSKRAGGYSYDDRQVKLHRVSDGPTPPPLPPFPPSAPHSLQHQNSGFSINDAFSSSLPPGHDGTLDFGEDPNNSAPSTPLDGIPPHHERFHRMLEEHRAREEARRPPLPPVPPPPPPPPSSPPPLPPPSA